MDDLAALEDFDSYCRLFTSVELWAPYARAVCQRHNLVPHAQVRLGTPGTYPAFLVEDRWVVKFFGRRFEGWQSFQVEHEAARLTQFQPEVTTARLVAWGELGGPGWPWPYLVFDLIPGVSIGAVMEQIQEEDRLRVAREIGSLARALHSISLEGQEDFPDHWAPYLEVLDGQRQTCLQNHRGWGTLPARLTHQIEDFLLPCKQWGDLARPPHLIHADLTRDHLLGRLEGGRWTTLALIDFGDAMTGSLAYELVALHLDLFGGDKRMLAAFLRQYAPLPALRWDHSASPFPRLALSAALLHRFNVLSILPPETFQVESLEELAHSIWNVSSFP